jgi:uncharacterized protein with GYD domain
MARYLFQASYTSEAWAVQVSNPQNRIDVVRSVIERLGGRLESGYLSFGDYDVVIIAEMPDAISAAAFSLATSAGGALKAIKTTPLLTVEEGLEAMKKAAGAGYHPPGQ